jgi:hypothetical protein
LIPSMISTRPQITLRQLWIAIPFFLIVIKGFLFPLPLLDFWWHLKLGEIIAATHSIPRTDIFSFTAAGKLYIVQNWLAEIIFYAVYRLGGFPLLVCLNAMLMAAALFPVYRLCRESAPSEKTAVFASFLTSVLFFGNLRPQVFSFLLFSIFLWVLEGYRARRRDRLLLLPLLMVLWVNLHGAFVLGLGLIALYLGAEWVRSLACPKPANALSGAELGKLSAVLIFTGAATLLNPETYRLYDYVRTVMADPSSQKFVMEWQPPRVNTLQGAVLFFIPLYLVLFVLVYSRKRPELTDLVLVAAFSIFGFTATRNSIWFALILAPVIARYWGEVDFGAVSGLIRPRVPAMAAENAVGRKSPGSFLNLLIGLALLGITLITSPWLHPTLYKVSLVESQTPVKAMDFIEQRGLKGNIFHPQFFGDYLIWRLYPGQKSFFDGRVHLFGETFVKEYQSVFVDSHWEEKLAPFGIRYLLLSKSEADSEGKQLLTGARASANWQVIFEDDVSVLFVKKEKAAGQAAAPSK